MKNELVSSLKQIAFSGMGVVAGLIEKPGPGIHASRQRVEVKKGTGCTGDHHKKDFWKGERIPGREITMFSAEVAHVLGADPLVVGDNIISEGRN